MIEDACRFESFMSLTGLACLSTNLSIARSVRVLTHSFPSFPNAILNGNCSDDDFSSQSDLNLRKIPTISLTLNQRVPWISVSSIFTVFDFALTMKYMKWSLMSPSRERGWLQPTPSNVSKVSSNSIPVSSRSSRIAVSRHDSPISVAPPALDQQPYSSTSRNSFSSGDNTIAPPPSMLVEYLGTRDSMSVLVHLNHTNSSVASLWL
mmetsp:Transcript_33312/g.54141  ORF Transcript_33312/g.54141 Transcript_33312/m.54141 type:complete len:207 (+) Transcript_33312:311-931(+)